MSQSQFGDFLRFRVMISPVVIMVLFWIGMVALVVTAVVLILQGNVLVGIGVLVLGPFVWRISCEFSIVVFRMHDCLEQIAKSTDTKCRQGTDAASDARGTDRSGISRGRSTEYGLLLSEISVGEKFETRDGKEFKVIEFTPIGLLVEFASGNRETFPPVDSGIPEDSWAFDIKRT
jgi:hypothetical protein